MPFLSLTKCSHRLGTFHLFIQICLSLSGTDPTQKTLSGFVALLGPPNTTSMTQLYYGVHSLPGCLLMDKLHLFTHGKTKPSQRGTWAAGVKGQRMWYVLRGYLVTMHCLSRATSKNLCVITHCFPFLIYFFSCLLVFAVLGNEHGVLQMLGKCSVSELHLHPIPI